MKNKFVEPTLEVIRFSRDDVVSTSIVDSNGSGSGAGLMSTRDLYEDEVTDK